MLRGRNGCRGFCPGKKGSALERTRFTGPAPEKRVSILTHGCKLNQSDSDTLARELQDAGYRVVGPSDQADVYVVNTCTVTHVADRKARRALRSARRRNPSALVIATGCYAQRAPDALAAMPEVDLVAGNRDKDRLGGDGRAGPLRPDPGWSRSPASGDSAHRTPRGPLPSNGEDTGGLRPGVCLLHRSYGARAGSAASLPKTSWTRSGDGCDRASRRWCSRAPSSALTGSTSPERA